MVGNPARNAIAAVCPGAMKPRIIICGLGRTGYKVFNLLHQQGAAVTGISDRPLPGANSAQVVVGDPTSAAVLLSAGVATAQTLVLVGDRDSQNLAILMQARLLNPNLRVVHRLYNAQLGDRLDSTLADHNSLSVSALAAPAFVFAALGSRAIGQVRLFDRLWPMREEAIDFGHPWLGRRLSELWDDRDRMLIDYLPVTPVDRGSNRYEPEDPHREIYREAHREAARDFPRDLQGDEPRGDVRFADRPNLVAALSLDRELQVGDRLIVAARPTRRPSQLKRRQRLQSFLDGLGRLGHQGRPAAIAFVVLLLAIVVSTILYDMAANSHLSLIEAFYFAVGTITGAGGKEDMLDRAPDALKIYTALLMLVGAGIVGICYALLNDYILGTRFQQVLEVVRLPKRGHFIVAGLGGLGLKTARELRAQGCEVVVIEQDPRNRFLATARSLQIPVVIGDATLPETLVAVGVERAEALLTTTQDELANLEIGLNARTIAPRLAIVLRNQDPQSAMMMQQVFEFETVLSPVELAAPAFAAAALGGRILGSGVTGDRLWVALGTLITPLHPLCGMDVETAAIHLDFVPLYLERPDHATIHGWELLQTILGAHDVLYLSIPACYLDRLWRLASDRILNQHHDKQFRRIDR